MSKISSTCFGQCFAHLQERKTEIFTAYGILQRCIYTTHHIRKYKFCLSIFVGYHML